MSDFVSNLYAIVTALEQDVQNDMEAYKQEAKAAGMTVTSYILHISSMSDKERMKYRKSLRKTIFKV